MVKRLRVMEKKLTNSGPFRESVDKHSIYAIKVVLDTSDDGGGMDVTTGCDAA
jgi:hypothetical protein